MGTNCDLLENLAAMARALRRDGQINAAHFMTEAHNRLILYERIIARYGDRTRMASSADPAMQFAIDVAMENEAGRGPA